MIELPAEFMRGEAVIDCETDEESIQLLTELDAMGYRWRGEHRLLSEDRSIIPRCYRECMPQRVVGGIREYYEHDNYAIIPFSTLTSDTPSCDFEPASNQELISFLFGM